MDKFTEVAVQHAFELDRLRSENKVLRECLARRGKSNLPEFVQLRAVNAALLSALSIIAKSDEHPGPDNQRRMKALREFALAAIAKAEQSCG